MGAMKITNTLIKGVKDFELQLYDTPDAASYGEPNTLTNVKKESTNNKQTSRFKNYTGISSAVSGLFFSGVGYTVGAAGSLLKDLAGYICSEIPNVSQYISNGIDYNTLQHFYTFLGDSLIRANQYGGLGAAVGLLGGPILILKLKNSVSSFFSSVLSIFKR